MLSSGLTKSKLSQNFPRAVLYGPQADMGLGKTNIYLRQGLSQIAILQKFLGSPTITGQLIAACIESAKVEIGIGRDLFSLDYALYSSWLTPCWIKSIWQFAHHNDIIIQDRSTPLLQLRRSNDLFLMEIFSQGEYAFSTAALQHINRCRIYLNVTTLSDICTGDGKEIVKLYYHGERDPSRPTYYKWPVQPKPSRYAWRLWRKAIKVNFLQPQAGMTLMYAMRRPGRWTDGRKDDWIWFYFPRTDRIYKRDGVRWKIFKRRGRGRMARSSTYVYQHDALGPPNGLVRATIERGTRDRLHLSGFAKEGPNGFIGHPHLDYPTDTARTIGDIDQLTRGIQEGNLRLVCDGSYKPEEGLGTAAWIIETEDQQHKVIGCHEVPGHHSFQCSYRSEFFGILGAIMTINRICKEHQIHEGSITLKCDGKGSIDVINYLHAVINNTRLHFDIIGSIKRAIDTSPIQWTFQHIKGHQDDAENFEYLDRWAQLNVMADQLAKNHRQQIHQHGTSQAEDLTLPFTLCAVRWEQYPGMYIHISSKLQNTLEHLITQRTLRTYWETKHNIVGRQKRYVDWEVSNKSAKSYKRKIWLAKWESGICGVGKMLKAWNYQNHDHCPRCGKHAEDVTHVVRCREPEATALWKKEIKKLEVWMTTNGGHPEMISAVCSNLNHWRDPEAIALRTPLTRDAVYEQSQIGWGKLLFGLMSKRWRQIQQQHFLNNNSQKSATLWMAKVQRRIWEIAWELWMHRNNMLHDDNKSVHYEEASAIRREIRKEYRRQQWATQDHVYLFQTSVQDRLNDSITRQQLWLTSVWAAQRQVTSDFDDADPLAKNCFRRWKRKLNLDDDDNHESMED
jgi:ribonuclease HI